mmetsp:Transcript_4902/g.14200  ORF Transcript_4902/g.14200 Transcript_4902/m.14200 type:complete len:250 (+) Transcript_4902:921-1670(+)
MGAPGVRSVAPRGHSNEHRHRRCGDEPGQNPGGASEQQMLDLWPDSGRHHQLSQARVPQQVPRGVRKELRALLLPHAGRQGLEHLLRRARPCRAGEGLGPAGEAPGGRDAQDDKGQPAEGAGGHPEARLGGATKARERALQDAGAAGQSRAGEAAARPLQAARADQKVVHRGGAGGVREGAGVGPRGHPRSAGEAQLVRDSEPGARRGVRGLDPGPADCRPRRGVTVASADARRQRHDGRRQRPVHAGG